MGCDLYYRDGKLAMVVCSRSSPRKRCAQCGAPATKLCDFPLAGAKAGRTCDKPLCAKCATEVDVTALPERHQLEFDARHPNPPPGTVEFDPDTVDVCPAHARFVRAKKEDQ